MCAVFGVVVATSSDNSMAKNTADFHVLLLFAGAEIFRSDYNDVARGWFVTVKWWVGVEYKNLSV